MTTTLPLIPSMRFYLLPFNFPLSHFFSVSRGRPRCLSQDLAKFFGSRCHVTVCGAGDANRPRRVRRAGEWAAEQAQAVL